MSWWPALALAGAALAAFPFVREGLRPRPARTGGRFATLSRGRTHYRWRGPASGPVAVCVHGLTTPSCVWDAVADLLVALEFRVLTYDLYGRGLSDRPPGRQTPGFFNEQLGELLEHQGVRGPVTLLGYSMGGAVATGFAAAHPARVGRLVLIAPGGLGHDLGRFPAFAARCPPLGDWLFLLAGGLMLRRGIRAEARQVAPVIPGLHREMAAETRLRGFASAVLSSLRHMLGRDMGTAHRKIAAAGIPVLSIWGEEDGVIPITGMEKLARANPAARQVTVPGAGHGIPYTHPGAVRAALRDVLNAKG